MNRLSITAIIISCFCQLPAQIRTNAVLSKTSELRALSEDEAKQGLRFDLTAQIIHKFTGITGCAFNVIDETGGARMIAADNPQSFTYEPGDVIRWRGITGIDSDRDFYAKCDTTERVGHRPLPPVVEADPKLIPSGKYNYTRIRVRGRITSAFRDEIDPEYQYLVLEANDCIVYASKLDRTSGSTNLSALVDAKVEITGTCVPTQSGRRIFLGPSLRVSGSDGIRILEAPPDDPFDVPYINDPHHIRAAELTKDGRRRIDGVVIATWQGNQFMLQTDSGNRIRIEMTDGPLPTCGSRVAVVGHLATDLFHLNFSQAIWKPLSGKGSLDERPSDISTKELLFDSHGKRRFRPNDQGRIFRLTGKVRTLPPLDDPSARMMLSYDENIIPIDVSSCPEALTGLELNCQISVVGVCVLNVPNWNPGLVFPRIEGLSLVVRRKDNITVISRPPWWTPKKMTMVIGGLLTLLAVGALWIHILNRIITWRSLQLTKEKSARDRAETRIEERNRLAVELHDALSQTLTGVAFQIDAAEAALRKNPTKVQQYLAIARRTLTSCREELRNCLWDLQNHSLDAKDTEEAIRETIEPHVGDCDVAIGVKIPRVKLSDSTFHALLCIIRELVVNAIRHGHPHNIEISGQSRDGIISLTVADDGCGFDPALRPGLAEGHFGLHGISERVDRLEGSLTIDSAPGNGTRISITMRNGLR